MEKTNITEIEWIQDGSTVYALREVKGKWHKGMPIMENAFYLNVQQCEKLEAEKIARLIAAAPVVTDTLFKTYCQLLKELPSELRYTSMWQYLLASMRSDLSNAYGLDPQDLEEQAIQKATQP